MANEMFTQLPVANNATMNDIIAAVQGAVMDAGGVSVQETLGQVFTLFLANAVLNFAGNPNGNVAGVQYGFCWDTTDNILYTCTASGTATTAVWTRSGSVTFPIPMSDGGTGANLTPSNGGLVFSNASTMAILAGTATANQIPFSGANSAPSWSPYSLPATVNLNSILFATTTTNIGQIAPVNNAVLASGSSGVPGMLTTLPIQVQTNITELGTITVGTWNGSIIGGTFGGTGINNGASLLTYAANVTFAGAFTSVLNFTGATNVIFPTTGTLATTSMIPSFPLSMANGGTGASLTAASGAIPYSGASAMALLPASSVNEAMLWGNGSSAPSFAPYSMPSTVSANSMLFASSSTVVTQLAPVDGAVLTSSIAGFPTWLAPGTAGAVLQSGTTPAWSPYTFPPAPLVANELFVAASTTAMTQLATANNSILGTNGSGVPAFTQTLPGAVQISVASINSGAGASGTTFYRGDGTWAAPSGSGTVNSGLAGQVAFYAANGTAVSGESEVSLAQGGTNAALTASNGGIVYSTASALSILGGTATAGLALLSGASGAPIWSTNKPITKINLVTITTSGTYTPSPGLVEAFVEVCAGGGSCALTTSTGGQFAVSGGGGGGGYAAALLSAATIGASQVATVGLGGIAPVTNSGGNTGGNSSLGTLVVATGGLGGTIGNSSATLSAAVSVIGGNGTTGTKLIPGGSSSTAWGNNSLLIGSAGGGSVFASNGTQAISVGSTQNGSAGIGFGAGANGGITIGATTATAFAGNPGVIYITEFISI